MTGLTYLLMCFLYFVCVGLDVALFFLQIRLVLLWRNINWLIPFDNAGKTLVDAVTAKVPQFLKTQNPLSERGKLIVTFKPIKTAFNLDTFPSCVLSVCVSALCIIGINHFLRGSIEVILLPYAAMAIAIILILLFSFIGLHFKGTKDRLSDYTVRKKDIAKTDNKQLRR